MKDFNDPATYRAAYEFLRGKYSDKEARDALQQMLQRQNAPELVKSGAYTPAQGVEAYGGAGAPGVVSAFGNINTEKPDEFAAKKRVALIQLKDIQKAYGRGKIENIGTGADISLGGEGGNIDLLKGTLKSMATKAGTDKELRQDINIYTSLLSSFPGTFTQAFGSGAPQEPEFLRLMEAAPGEKSTNREAKAWFDNVSKWLGGVAESTTNTETMNLDTATGINQGVNQGFKNAPDLSEIATTEDFAPEESNKDLTAKDVVRGVAKAAPIAFGVAGGLGGSLLGMGVGSVLTGAIGTTVGVASGTAVQNMIEDLIGEQDQAPTQQLEQASYDAVLAGSLDLATGGLFHMGGKAVSAVTPKIIKNAINNLSIRGIRPSASQQRKFYEKTGVEFKDFTIKKGLFSKGVQQIDEMIQPVQGQFDDIALNEDVFINKQLILDLFDNQIDEAGQLPFKKGQQFVKALQDEKDAFTTVYKSLDEIPIKKLTKGRRALDTLIPSTKWSADNAVDAGAEVITRNIYQNSIIDATEKAGISGLRDLGQELQKLYEFQNIAAAQQYLGTGTLPLGLLKTIGIGAGGAAFGYGASGGNLVSALLFTVGLPTLANNPRVIATTVVGLRKAWQVADKLPEAQKAKFMTDAFRRILTNVGALSMSEFGKSDEMTEQPPELGGDLQ